MITINSKYKIGDMVWTMSLNKPVHTRITDLHLDHNYIEPKRTPEQRLEWELEQCEPNWITGMSMNDPGLPIKRSEDQLFDTREELIASLP